MPPLSSNPAPTFPEYCSLDNVCAEPNASDSRYLSILHTTYARHQDFPRTAPKDVVSSLSSQPLLKGVANLALCCKGTAAWLVFDAEVAKEACRPAWNLVRSGERDGCRC